MGSLTFHGKSWVFKRDLYTNSQSPCKIGQGAPKGKKKSSSNHPFSGKSCWFTGVINGYYMKPTQTMHYFSGKSLKNDLRNIPSDQVSSLIHPRSWVPLGPLLKTNSLPLLKNDGPRKTIPFLDWVQKECLFSGANWLTVKFQGGIYSLSKLIWSLKIEKHPSLCTSPEN